MTSTANTNNTNNNNNNNNTQAFYRLKVEDALSYLDQVKLQFSKQPDVYNQFLDIMKEFKSQSIDTPGVISRVSNLFKGHSDLIEGFNTFLPPGYKIEVQANNQVHVTSPNSSVPSALPNIPTTTTTVAGAASAATTTARVQQSINVQTPTATVVNIGNVANPLIQLPNTGIASIMNAHNFIGNLPANTAINIPANKLYATTTAASQQPTPATTPPLTITRPTQQPQQRFDNVQSQINAAYATSLQQQNATTLTQATSSTHTAAAAATGSQASASTTTPNQVEFGHAINYVNKIKNRFQNQPDIYKAFLDILHTYQKQQKNLKEGVYMGQTLSEAEVYAKVAKLFKNQEDLLQEFSQFLPDANANASAMQVTTLNETTNLAGSMKYAHLDQQQGDQGKNTPNSMKNKYSSKQLKLQSNQENSSTTTHQTTTITTATNKNLISNMASSKTSSSNHQIYNNSSSKNSSSNAMANTGSSMKRPSSNQQISSKKQKLSALKQSNSNNNASLYSGSNQNSGSAINSSGGNNFNLMQINDADYINSINEITFFEHVKKALRTPEVYKNFLRCIALFNQEIVNRLELIKLVEPYLGKFAELYRWFKNYVDDKDDRINEALSNKNQINKERIDLPAGDNIALEIDYSSCKQYGASYREISAPYSQSVCSGRTDLCKEVLNDSFVSFPCWSEDTTFLTSKKNQYEELLFRTEDERFELDVILENNLSTIRVLESVQKKIGKMTPDERNKFRLDNCLGGSSEIIHFKAIQLIYGDKAKDFIEGIKRNPAVAVPLVLKRLKAKDEEWRDAKKTFEKQWRELIEKNYLKSLDYCAVPFKQSDQKHLKTRSLLNEIETIYFERQEAKEEGQDVAQSPHLTFKYDDKSILEDAAALIIHHVKRQPGIQKEDKQKIKQIVYYFLPDLFFVPRGALSDDEADDEDDESSVTAGSITAQNGGGKKKDKKQARHTDTNKRRLTDVDEKPKDVPEEYKSPEDMYRLFFVDDHWYLFFRYHQILCERLYKIYKISMNFAEQESNDAKTRQKSVADALKLRNKCKIDTAPSEFYPAFLDIVRNLLDGNIDGCQYEDTLREMFGIHAYNVFTLDKVVQNCVRQLQYLVQEENCTTLRDHYLEEQRNSATGGKVANMQLSTTQNSELAYQKRVESLLQEQNCFKILMYKNSGRLTIELLDTEETQEDINENEMNEIEKWSEYIEKYCSDENNQISDDLKEALLNRPVFSTRAAHCLKKKLEDDEKKDNLEVVDNLVCKFDVNSYKMKYEPNTSTFMYRKNSIKNARKSHHTLTKGMYDKFKKYLNKWLKEHSVTADCIDDWLVGETLNNPNIKTTCNKDCSLKKSPYHVIYKYKTQRLNSTTATNVNTNSMTTATTSSNKKEKSNSNENSNDSTTTTTTTQQEANIEIAQPQVN